MKYIFFDLDGTIIDSSEGIINAFKYAVNCLNLEYKSEIEHMIGIPIGEVFDKVYNLRSIEIEKAIKKYREYYTEKGINENTIYGGIKELLEKLRKSGKKLIIATSKPTVFTQRILQHYNIISYFDFVSGATLDKSRQKKSDVINYAIKNLETIKLDESIMIGDRAEDIKGAKVNNIKSVGVLYGFGNKEELEDAGADFIANDIKELEKIVLFPE